MSRCLANGLPLLLLLRLSGGVYQAVVYQMIIFVTVLRPSKYTRSHEQLMSPLCRAATMGHPSHSGEG
jgi:hypothetical protein